MSGASLEILIDRSGSWFRAAAVENGVLTDLHCDRDSLATWTDAVVRGRVIRRGGGGAGKHVDVGLERPGYLEVGSGAKDPAALPALSEGRSFLFQVRADPSGQGRKGVTLSRDLVLAGRFLAYVPHGQGIQISRRISAAAVRAGLKARLLAESPALGAQTLSPSASAGAGGGGWAGGWIVRAAARVATPEQIDAEACWLRHRWRRLAEAADGPPGVLLPPPDAVERLLRDTAGRPLSRLWLTASVMDKVRARLVDGAPDLVPRLEIAEATLFERHDLEGQFAALFAEWVSLSGGGSLVISPTEALVAVDVNAGPQGNPAAVNREAATALVRQLRLRNLAGMVVVDFLTLPGRPERVALERHLAAAAASDPAGVQIYGFTAMGLLELTRRRRGPSLATLAV